MPVAAACIAVAFAGALAAAAFRAPDVFAAAAGLTPGVSTVDAFMAREPGPPASGQDALRLAPLVEAYGKELNRDQDLLGERSNRLAGQVLPDGTVSVAQAMAVSGRMRNSGDVSALMLLQQHLADPQVRSHRDLLYRRYREAADAIAGADAWLETARTEADHKYQNASDHCPDRQLGELTEKDPTCMRSAQLAYQESVRRLAPAYLQRVVDPMNAYHASTKVVVDEDMEFAKKLESMPGDQLRESWVYGAESSAIGYVIKYNDKLVHVVDTAAELAAFKVDLVDPTQ